MNTLLRQVERIAELQRHLLPRRIPEPEGWRIAVHYSVGARPGGDYYDVLPLPDGRLLLFIGDASDEGGPATVMVALARSVLRSCPLSSGIERSPFCPFREPLTQPPHLILGHLGHVLCENTLEEQFMTAFCGVLSPAEGTLHYSNAGHVAPSWWRARTRSVEAVRAATGMPLGLVPTATYHHQRLMIDPGDVLVFCTDGLTAALSPDGSAFGTQRVNAALLAFARHGADAVRDSLLESWSEFLGDTIPQDDITIVVLERKA